ncbi:MAG: energy transducer TonB [Bacteroidota bacterium]
MKTKALILRHWEDVVFENRNKAYGAYSLRRTYSEKIIAGLFISTGFVTALLILPKIISMFTGAEVPIIPTIPNMKGDIKLFDVRDLPRRQQPPERTAQPRVQNRDVPPRVVRDEIAEAPVIDTPVEPVVGIEGDGTGTVAPIEGEGSTGTITETQVIPMERIVLSAQVMPVYDGGMEGMMRYITKKLKYPASARRQEIEGIVYVSFVVNGDGSVSNVEVIKGIHADCDKEAMRVIASMPGWTGGKQGGYPVGVKMVLPIKFRLNI